jgi:hypothetical protein
VLIDEGGIMRSRRSVLVGAVLLGLLVPAIALGAGEGKQLIAGKRNPSASTYSAPTEIIANNSSFGTRQSNVGAGGGAIYGCRATTLPCIRSNNLKGGRAFEFVTTGGKDAGFIQVGNANTAPLTTNAKAVATGFNADQVDGKHGTDLVAKAELLFAAVSDAGQLGSQRGAQAAALTNPATNTYTVTFAQDVSKCTYTATPVGPANTNRTVGVAAGADPRTVTVDMPDNPALRAPFHTQVVC